MKIAIKRVYCPRCGKLVRTREQAGQEMTQLFCARCGQLVWQWDGIKWLQTRPQ
jgi:ribosomal protein S27AE